MDEVDAAAPGTVEDLYATGSIGLGDFHPDISDIDLVAVGTEPPDEAQLRALAQVHRPSRPHVDVLYLTRDDLSADPRPLSRPCSLEGTFHPADAFSANPVTWRDLQTCALTVRGRQLDGEDVWFDPDVLRQWNCDNLDQYWRAQVDTWRRVQLSEALVRHEYGLQWLVLGVARLHYTIATLELTSKTGAGYYALEVADRQWHPVIEAAIALRADQTASFGLSLEEARDQAVLLATFLIEDAHRLVSV